MMRCERVTNLMWLMPLRSLINKGDHKIITTALRDGPDGSRIL